MVLALGTALGIVALVGETSKWQNFLSAGSQVTSDVAREEGLKRRELALAGGVLSMLSAFEQNALAEAPAAPAAKLQRLLINVGKNEDLEKELAFWQAALDMKVLSDAPGSDGLRVAVVGYGPEFGIEYKVDPAVIKRGSPKVLNYEIMQPYVNALNYLQIAARGKAIEIFQRVEEKGGTALQGNGKYLDLESPRGVRVRAVPRTSDPKIEFVCFNIEVPAFDGVRNFYTTVMGFKEIQYQKQTEPPIQKLSVYLESEAGGPRLLLSPVPDGRIKDRRLDEFEGVKATVPATGPSERIGTEFVDRVLKESEASLKKAKEDWVQKERAKGNEVTEADAPTGRKTRPLPSLEKVGNSLQLNDGVGDIVLLSSTADFESGKV